MPKSNKTKDHKRPRARHRRAPNADAAVVAALRVDGVGVASFYVLRVVAVLVVGDVEVVPLLVIGHCFARARAGRGAVIKRVALQCLTDQMSRAAVPDESWRGRVGSDCAGSLSSRLLVCLRRR